MCLSTATQYSICLCVVDVITTRCGKYWEKRGCGHFETTPRKQKGRCWTHEWKKITDYNDSKSEVRRESYRRGAETRRENVRKRKMAEDGMEQRQRRTTDLLSSSSPRDPTVEVQSPPERTSRMMVEPWRRERMTSQDSATPMSGPVTPKATSFFMWPATATTDCTPNTKKRKLTLSTPVPPMDKGKGPAATSGDNPIPGTESGNMDDGLFGDGISEEE